MPGYKLIVKNAKVILKTVTNAVLNISGIKDLLTGSGSVDSNNKIDWTLQEYTNTAANFTSNNPILLLGQKGIETDDLLTAPKFKIGDGVTDWNTLPYANIGGGGGGGVPYTGATANVDLGEFELKAGQIELDQTPTGTASVAVTRWNDTIGSTETTLKGGSVIIKNGVDLVARVVNKVVPNTTLTKAAYQVVKVSGAQGQRLAVDFAQGNNDLNSADTIGVVTETILTNQEGFILTVGQIEEINTTGSLQSETWVDGDVLYLSPTVAGAMTNIKPTGLTGHIVVLGYVEYAHAIHGKIYVKIMNGWELDELHNVYINPTTLANNDVLTYDSASSLWKNKQIDNIFTVQFETGTLSPADATTYYFSDVRLAPNLTATNFNYNLGSAYTIIGARISISNNVVSGTTELATLQIRNITQSTSSSLGTFRTDATSTSIKGTTFTGASISVAASDDIVAQIDFPTYATNPTNIIIFLTLICKK